MEAAFFDLDKTVIAKSSTLAFSRPLYRAGFLNRRALLKAAVGQLVYMMVGADHDQIERLRDQLQALTRGWDRYEIERIVRETVDEVIAPHVFAEALAVIDDHRRSGHRVVIVSSSPEEVVRPLARHIGLHEVIATRSRVDANGRYTGEIEFYAYGPRKAEAVVDYAIRTRGTQVDAGDRRGASATIDRRTRARVRDPGGGSTLLPAPAGPAAG